MSTSSDLIVVGGGIVGLTHAWEAHRRGLKVAVIDRDARPVGASVRNFGHACLSAQPDEHDTLLEHSREGWLTAGGAAGLWLQTDGGLVIARSAAQQQLIEQFAAARPERTQLLTAAEATAALIGGARDLPDVTGGVRLTRDLRVDPREAAPRLAAWLADRGVELAWRTACLGTADGVVRTTRGDLRAEHVIVCVGHDVDLLFPDIADAAGVRRCALQMALVEPPADLATHAAVLSATSMLRYGGMAAMPAAADVRAELETTAPELLAMAANVMFAARPDGSVLVGDSHGYGLSQEPWLDETISAHLLREVAHALGLSALTVRQRWQGIYASSDRSDLLVEAIDDRTTLASVTCGVGMTMSFGLARRTLDGLV